MLGKEASSAKKLLKEDSGSGDSVNTNTPNKNSGASSGKRTGSSKDGVNLAASIQNQVDKKVI